MYFLKANFSHLSILQGGLGFSRTRRIVSGDVATPFASFALFLLLATSFPAKRDFSSRQCRFGYKLRLLTQSRTSLTIPFSKRSKTFSVDFYNQFLVRSTINLFDFSSISIIMLCVDSRVLNSDTYLLTCSIPSVICAGLVPTLYSQTFFMCKTCASSLPLFTTLCKLIKIIINVK